MSEIENNENVQIIVEDNNQNLTNNNQSNLGVVQNAESNIPFIDQPYMDPQDPQTNFQLNNPPIHPNNIKDNKKSWLCLISICVGVCLGTFTVSCGFSILFLYLFALWIQSQGGFY